MQRELIAGLASVLLLAALPALSAEKETAQQQKMGTCNTEASSKGLKGADRKAFMKTCLSSKESATAGGNSQQEKMKSCNATAGSKHLAGADRKTFMKSCLSGAG
jgi:hypothetical protein